MGLARRDLLRLAAGLPGLALPAASLPARSAERPPLRLWSASGDGAGRYALRSAGSDGAPGPAYPLGWRGHGLCLRPGGWDLACPARRPGDALLVLDAVTGARIAEGTTPSDRHLYGHAAYSPDGDLLYTTENALPAGEGRIGVWDAAAGYRRLGDLPSHGVGPHELLLAPDGAHLIVANGGILTRPETGRAKLNLDTMRPSLALVNRHTGDLVEEHRLPESLHQLSIRHIALAEGGVVCAALQYQGPASERPPLVALAQPGAGLELLHAPDAVQAAMRNYCGGVCADPSGRVFAVSAPRGDLITLWGVDGGFLGARRVPDGCGVAPGEGPGVFYLSSGRGGLYRLDLASGVPERLPGSQGERVQWDNHLLVMSEVSA